MKKRIVSLLLVFLMVISVMPLSGLTAFAAHSSTVFVGGKALEPGEYITGATAYNAANKSTYKYLRTEAATRLTEVEAFVTAPVAGEMPKYEATVPAGANYEVLDRDVYYTKDGVRWNKGTKALNPDDPAAFKAGEKYTVEVYLIGKQGYDFIKDDSSSYGITSSKINGEAGKCGILVEKVNGKTVAVVNYEFTVPAATILEIPEVEVTVASPVDGNAPAFTAVIPDDVNYTVPDYDDSDLGYVNGVMWEKVDGGTRTSMTSSDEFEAGKSYLITVLLKADEGYEFKRSSSGVSLDFDSSKVNGKDSSGCNIFDSSNEIIQIQYLFTAYDLWVGGVGMHDGDYLANGASATTTEKPSGGYAYYKDGVLTLHDYEFEDECDLGYVVYCPKDLTIELEGENTLTNNESESAGIYADGNLTIGGEGSVAISADEACILSYDLTIKDSCTVTADSLIWAATLTVQDDCALTLDGTDGISVSNDFVVTGGTVIITVNGDDDDGVYASYDVIISGGSVTVTAGNRGIYSHSGTVTISGGEVDVTAPNDNGIDAYYEITINGDVRVSAGGYGIKSVHRGIDVTGGSLEIKSTATGDDDAGNYALKYSVGEGGKLSVAEGMSVLAATEVDGTFVEYDKDENNTYDHVKIGEETTLDPTVIESVEFTASKEAPVAGEAQYTFELSKVNGSEADEDLGLLSFNFEWYVSDTACDDPYSEKYQSASGAFEADKFYMIFIDAMTTRDDIVFSDDCTFKLRTEGSEVEFDFDEIGENSDEAALAMFYEVNSAAPTTYNVWVLGTQVTAANASDVLGDGNVSYDPATNTLTVKRDLAATGDTQAIRATTSDVLNIALTGKRSITGKAVVINTTSGAIIAADDNVTVSAETGAPAVLGNLTVNAPGKNVTLSNTSGMFLQSTCDLTVTATSVNASAAASGAPAMGKNVSVTATGNVNLTNSNGYIGINATVSGANVTINGAHNGGPLVYNKVDITATGNVKIENSNGMITATNGTLNIKNAKKVTVTGNASGAPLMGSSDIKASGDVSVTNSAGFIGYNTTVSGDNVTIKGAYDGPLMWGDAEITAKGDVKIENSDGMITNSDGTLNIKNAKKVTVTGKFTDGPIMGSADITASGDVTMKNPDGLVLCGTLDIKANDVLLVGAPVGTDSDTVLSYKNAKGAAYAVYEGESESALSVVANKSAGKTYTSDMDVNVIHIKPKKPTTTTTTTTTTQPSPETQQTIERLAGDNRVDTAVEISKEGWDKADTVIIASSEKYPDALAGAALAENLNAPVLLNNSDKLEAAVLAEINRLGAKKVVILGGTAAISQDIEDNLSKLFTVERISGENRNGTAAEIAGKLCDKSDIAFLVSNQNYADALSVSPVAALKGAPILYVNPDGSIPAETASALNKLGCTKVYIIGGTAAVGSAAETTLGKLSINVERVYGDDRYLTSVAVNKKFADVFTGKGISVATGKDFPDALAGAAFAAKNSIPVYLVSDDMPASAANTVNALGAETIFVFGGKAAVSDAAVAKIAK